MNFRFVSTFILSGMISLSSLAQTKVIAHRGYWKKPGSAQNSITALKESAAIKVYGSEFDVLSTKDGVLVVNHDDSIAGMDIQSTNYAMLKDLKLKNGEKLPTLEVYLVEGARHPDLKLILELKPLRSTEAENKAVADIVAMVDRLGVKPQTEYISFSMNSCKEFKKLRPEARIAYLNGEVSPADLKKMGFIDLDYNYRVLIANKKWMADAKKEGIRMNSWTVNDLAVMEYLIDNGVELITTDYPEQALEIISKKNTNR